MIILVGALLIFAYLLERWSLKNALAGIKFEKTTSRLLVEPEEQFGVVSKISNTSRRFVSFIRVTESLPKEIRVHAKGGVLEIDYRGLATHTYSVFMMPKKELVRTLPVSLPNRGRYFFRGAEMKGGDFLGISDNTEYFSTFCEVVVMPGEISVSEVEGLLGGFLGDISVRRYILEDPVLTVGGREYTGREPMKSISWPMSARTGRLMVKQFDYTIEPTVTVILDVDCDGKNIEELLEACFSIARTVCRTLEERRVIYDFCTNATTSSAFSQWSYISDGLGTQHLYTILEGLGRATYSRTKTFTAMMQDVYARIGTNRSAIIITPAASAERSDAADTLRERTGGNVVVIEAGEVVA